MKQNVCVIGGGAAGFFCAVNVARMNRSLNVVLLERSSKLLSKVKVSGGGRCNVTHACFSISDMAKRYPRGGNFLKRSFSAFFTTDTIRWFAERGVELKTEDDGRMFPVTDNSQSIINCLLDEASKYNVDVRLNTSVTAIDKRNEKWAVQTAAGKDEVFDHLVVACGGFPKADQFQWICKTGHTISPPVPSLFTFNIPGNSITELMGIAQHAAVKIKGTKFREEGALLITHWGFSGPAVLRLSAWAARALAEQQYKFTVIINWLPAFHENSCREAIVNMRHEHPSQKTGKSNPFSMPARLWHYFLSLADVSPDTRWADLTAKSQNVMARLLTGSEFNISGKTTFKEEFVTAGGINLDEIDALTMQSKLHDALYFAGEIMNVDGITGGFNFQHAWTSGYLAAYSIANKTQI